MWISIFHKYKSWWATQQPYGALWRCWEHRGFHFLKSLFQCVWMSTLFPSFKPEVLPQQNLCINRAVVRQILFEFLHKTLQPIFPIILCSHDGTALKPLITVMVWLSNLLFKSINTLNDITTLYILFYPFNSTSQIILISWKWKMPIGFPYSLFEFYFLLGC